MHSSRTALLALLFGGLASCTFSDGTNDDADAASVPASQPAPPPPAPMQTESGLSFIVDISDRRLIVMDGQDTLRTDPVAVGTADHPTPVGEWTIDRVDWNPDWTPPPGEDWTEDKEKQPPGSALNPMGRARLIFNPPYSIHGTKDRASLGEAESHGSIRVANETVIALGRLIMERGGAQRPETFFQEAEADRTKMHQIPIPNRVPIKIQQ